MYVFIDGHTTSIYTVYIHHIPRRIGGYPRIKKGLQTKLWVSQILFQCFCYLWQCVLPKHAHYSTIFAKVVPCKWIWHSINMILITTFFFIVPACQIHLHRRCLAWGISACWSTAAFPWGRQGFRERERERVQASSNGELLDAHLRQTTRQSCKVDNCFITDFK